MSSSAGSSGQGWPTPLYELIATTDAIFPRWEDDGVSLPLTQALVSKLLPQGPVLCAGDIGLMVCFLPLDISLRAYAIDAIKGTVAEAGFDVLLRRDVPIRPEVLGDAAFTRPHVSQFVILRPHAADLHAFEIQLMQLKPAVTRAMVEFGLTHEEFEIVSCSAGEVRYGSIAGNDDLTAIYPDLIGLRRGTPHLRPEFMQKTGAKPA